MHHKKKKKFSCACIKWLILALEHGVMAVSVIKIHENDNVSKTLLLLLCISDISKRWAGRNIDDLIDKKNQEKIQS